jgi:hypothetical protein
VRDETDRERELFEVVFATFNDSALELDESNSALPE